MRTLGLTDLQVPKHPPTRQRVCIIIYVPHLIAYPTQASIPLIILSLHCSLCIAWLSSITSPAIHSHTRWRRLPYCSLVPACLRYSPSAPHRPSPVHTSITPMFVSVSVSVLFSYPLFWASSPLTVPIHSIAYCPSINACIGCVLSHIALSHTHVASHSLRAL
ncbi:hypothetical protein L226DRAFT_46601 [Lentinus tigrinus ALCF2SS1-7]|uniref:Uncharacterized protein n=1 Tax=Lentinus tigrinus ALCF2SS1-6 TaxID=1328759 RepID=A0A5C2RYA7_9APHY|nr:hypothetical protein L227DRAFT_292479 [Lentinus tigrinus ALCF2SS1-6]RPD75511.1 hypothetical protein L226DRAFT_46601 [Lentinus tigrinus ALCF2SS1-7]